MTQEQRPNYDVGDVIAEQFILKKCSLVDELREIWIAEEQKPGLSDQDEIAIELPSPDFLKFPEVAIAFEQRHATCKQFDHPNVESTESFGIDQIRNIPYLTMRVMKGRTLAELLRSSTSIVLPEDLVWNLISQAGAAVSHIHQRGYVHSNLKPAKLLIEADGTVKLIDFILARQLRPIHGEEGFDPALLGAITPAYAPIEMFEGEDPDLKDDLYAFAIIVYQILSGRHPYDRVSAPKAERLGLTPRAIHRLSRRQNRILARALKFRRGDRQSSVEEFVKKLKPKNSLIEMLHP